MTAVNSPEAVFLYGVVPPLAALALVVAFVGVRGWVRRVNARINASIDAALRHPVHFKDGDDDWMALADAVREVHQANDEIARADERLWEIENGWQSA